MSQSKKRSYETIPERRKRLKREIHQLEEKYAGKISIAKRSVHSALTPLQSIRKNPVKAVGIALLFGFAISYSGKKRDRKNSGSSRTNFSSLLLDELKRVGARKAITILSDVVDREVIPRFMADRNNDIDDSN